MRARLLTLIALAAAAPVAAQSSTKLVVAGTSKIEILGTSNLHDWTCSTNQFSTSIEVPAASKDIGKDVKAIVAEVPVKNIDCEHRGMAGNLQKAMNADKNPTVKYRMTGYDAASAANGYSATIKGFLTINGVEKPVDMKATITPDGKGNVTAVASVPIRTPDYGVQPVSALFGRIKTGEMVTVKVEIVAAKATVVALAD